MRRNSSFIFVSRLFSSPVKFVFEHSSFEIFVVSKQQSFHILLIDIDTPFHLHIHRQRIPQPQSIILVRSPIVISLETWSLKQ